MVQENKNLTITKRNLIANSLSGVIQLVITAILTFICIPIFIQNLGTELYGVFAIVSIIGNLNIFANLGLNSALIKYLSEQGKCNESNNDIFVSLVIMCTIIIPITVFAFIYREFILINILGIPLKHLVQSNILYSNLLVSNMLLLIGQIFTAALDSMQKIYLTNITQLIYSIIYWGGIIIVVLIGHHLDWVGYAIFIATMCWFFLILILFLKNWGTIKSTNLNETFIATAKKQLSFGVKVYLSGFIGFFNEPLFKILISNSLGLNVVAYFEIGLKIRGQLTGLFSKVLQPLYPYLSSLRDKQRIAFLVKDLTSKMFLFVLPVCAMLIITCKDIVTLWLRVDIFNYSIFIVGLVVPYLILSPLTLPIYTYLLAKDHPERTIIIQSLSVIVNILIFYLLFSYIGMIAVIISNILSYLASYILGLYYQSKYLNIKYKFKTSYALRILCLLILFIVTGFTSIFFNNEFTRILYTIIVLSVLVVLIYKRLKLITLDDIKRYFGDNILIINIFNKI
ncbi:Membrane protein involved in the export of O-antigen and teichoic acid [Bacteroides luti]|uniref:Membrane protein involved in the export of O-antigen and teichoic acid n=2 Tax=Bacteroides luti TaxID=1297750 RepID=A0A1M4STU3_9BACE|nr:Membrane protein involved in the export of O-antigen and teichoic acid [Bacteroides luti]